MCPQYDHKIRCATTMPPTRLCCLPAEMGEMHSAVRCSYCYAIVRYCMPWHDPGWARKWMGHAAAPVPIYAFGNQWTAGVPRGYFIDLSLRFSHFRSPQ